MNQPPVANCKNVTVFAEGNCVADASVDDGSFDPDAGDFGWICDGRRVD